MEKELALNCSLGQSHIQFRKPKNCFSDAFLWLLHYFVTCRYHLSGLLKHIFWLCNFSQCPAGGGRVRHQEKGEASAELSEILPRLQAAQGVGAPHPRVAAPPGRRLPGTGCGKNTLTPDNHAEVEVPCVSSCLYCLCISCQSWITLSFVTAHAIKSRHLELWHFPLRSSYKW